MTVPAPPKRTPARRKARQLAKHLRAERPDYAYLKEVFRHLRAELDVEVTRAPQAPALRPHRGRDPPLLPGRLDCPPRPATSSSSRPCSTPASGSPSSSGSASTTSTSTPVTSASPRARATRTASSRSPPRSRKPLACTWTPCAAGARSTSSSPAGRSPTAPAAPSDARPLRQARRHGHPVSPHRLRHFLFTWVKTQGIDDALIQPYSGHASRQSLEVYSRIALADAQHSYNQVIDRFPV